MSARNASFGQIRTGLSTAPEAPVALPLPAARTASFRRYRFTEDLAAAVNVALTLGRPLLVTGEPGTGKTALAWGVAEQLGAGDVLEFHAKSSSTARDLLYVVDHLRRYHDASTGDDTARAAENYIQFQALGTAIRSSRTRVVLVDEIDKAPRDFPNDLLNEIDRMAFSVPEIGPDARHEATVPHVLIITSNSERRLPAAFLRRCVYHHIPFPEREELREIVTLHTADLEIHQSFLSLVVERFVALRAIEGLAKPPATDELIAWARVLHEMGVTDADLSGPTGQLPALSVLIKHRDDARQVQGRG